jgi:hypothetical protein
MGGLDLRTRAALLDSMYARVVVPRTLDIR